MTTQLSPHRSRRSRDTRHSGARLGRLATVLAAVISGLLASAAAATAAFARTAMIPVPTGGGDNGDPVPAVQTVTRIVVVGGMAGWQIALIAFGAALAAAAAAVVLDRKLAGRRRAAVAA
jgi:hypothetical protein